MEKDHSVSLISQYKVTTIMYLADIFMNFLFFYMT
jgi:hypothetical protein